MPIPVFTSIETPILHELSAIGGKDDVRFLYNRLISYFPTLSDAEISNIKNGKENRWKNAVQKAGKALDEQNLITRERGIWSLTKKGIETANAESSGIIINKTEVNALSHTEIQRMIFEIGEILGYFSALEFEYYDAIWRENAKSPRISHVFEVQSKGNLDSAFAKLKRAFDAQRSKPFLILATERDTKRAQKSLSQEFRELENVITILSFVELRKIHENLKAIGEFLPKFLFS
ncbi:MAG TPA: winged helix-turn-helix domain-containing protein [Pyrinomonadaceae bacterium]|nr:winged helix-turn-helix domain-containing protein [Pyrinomonadaceae bacterium]